MGTKIFIQSEVSSPDGAKFKPENNVQVMDTISGNTKAGQLITKDISIPLNSAFWNKDEFNNKMLHSSQTENRPFTLGPTICVELIICNEQNIYWCALINFDKFLASGSSWNPGTSTVF